MHVKMIEDENFNHYREASMLIASCNCDWKCCQEAGVSFDTCQNSPVAYQPTIEINDLEILKRYKANPITTAIVIAGLEPMLQFDEVEHLIRTFRENGVDDTFVIYTGYYYSEIIDKICKLYSYRSIIVKFGRYIPDSASVFNKLLGVTLASDNQYSVRLIYHDDQDLL